jgi:hypothetical protein
MIHATSTTSSAGIAWYQRSSWEMIGKKGEGREGEGRREEGDEDGGEEPLS